jgi:uncharacterized protein YdhG (YjbR/CyaY superfamily)
VAQSKAETVDQYIAELPPERRAPIAAVRKIVLDNLPEGYVETMQYGMIGYVIPLDRYPVTYNKQALGYIALASQKSYMSLYLMNVYGSEETERWFAQRYADSGKKLNMGKSCVRFKKLEDLPIDLIGETVARTTVDEFIERYEASRTRTAKRR